MAIPGKNPWDLTEQSFHGLLEFLDPDRQRAGERYEKIREKLSRFFEWKGCIPGADYADETIDRVARRIEEVIETQPQDPYLYFHGVALNVVRERWRKAGRDPQPLETLPREIPAAMPASEGEGERRLGCLHDCLDRLTPASRDLVTAYHLRGSEFQMGRRKDLAQDLKIPASTLRLRVYRIRRQLERCLGNCLGGNRA